MTLEFDPTADFGQVVDGTETITFHRRTDAPDSPGVKVAGALRRPITTREAKARNRNHTPKAIASDGRYTAADVRWHLPADALAEPPHPGDAIVDAGGRRWTILEVEQAVLGGRWCCAARDVAIAEGLHDTIRVLKATYTKGDGGAAEATWTPWLTGLRSRIQPGPVETDPQHGSRATSRRFLIFVEEDLALDHTHRIEDAEGTQYRILGTLGAERIGELQQIDVEALG